MKNPLNYLLLIITLLLTISCDRNLDELKSSSISKLQFEPKSNHFKSDQDLIKEIYSDRIKIKDYESNEVILKQENIEFKKPNYTFSINFSIKEKFIELKKADEKYKIFFDDKRNQWLCLYKNKTYYNYQNLIPEINLTKDLLELYVNESDFKNSDTKYETYTADDKAPEKLCGSELIIVTKFNVVKSIACYEANADLQFECSNQYCIGCCFTYPGCDSMFAIDDYFGMCTCRGVPCIEIIWPELF